MVSALLISNSPPASVIVPLTFAANVIMLPGQALVMMLRSDPAPLSLLLRTTGGGSTDVTVKTIPVGLATDCTVKPQVMMLEKFPLSEVLVMMAKVSPTLGLN